MRKIIGLLTVLLLVTVAQSASANWNWSWTKGQDGVEVCYPSSGWTWTEGADGRRIVYPISGWTWTESRNGRRVIYPISGWTWTEDRTGRRIAYPISDWTWTEGSDGLRVVYPISGWTWTEGRDGHRIVYPLNGWTWREGSDGRRIAYPTSGDPWIRVEDILYNQLVSRIPLTDAQRPYLYLLLEQMGVDTVGSAYDPELNRAHSLLNRNDIQGARELFRSISRLSNSDYVRRDAAYMIGYCSANLKDYWQAIQEYRDFLGQYDRHGNERLIPDALYVLGVLNEYVSRKSEAAEAYRSCVSRFPATQVANQARERLKEIGYRGTPGRSRVALTAAVAPRRNPFEVVAVDTAQIARVCQFIYAVDRLEGVDEAASRLILADLSLETVQRYQRLLSEKRAFENMHQGAVSR